METRVCERIELRDKVLLGLVVKENELNLFLKTRKRTYLIKKSDVVWRSKTNHIFEEEVRSSDYNG